MARITMPEGTLVRIKRDGRVGVVWEAKNTIWGFTRRILPEGAVPTFPNFYGWFHIQELEELEQKAKEAE